jgi:hypothetical protein
MLGAAREAENAGAAQCGKEAPAGHAAKHVVMGEPCLHDRAAGKLGTEIADDRFDFGEFGHR